jgi:ABC-2 type transport system permease protein
MWPNNVWQMEILEEIKSTRSLSIKFLLSFILLSPLAISWVPAQIKSDSLTMAVIFLGVFGSSVGLVRWRDTKMLERLAMLPGSPSAILSDYILACSLIEGLQLAVPSALILITNNPEPIHILWIIVCFLAALVSANSIGVIVAILAKSSGEVHLYAFLAVILVAGLSGLFSGSTQGSPFLIEPIWPFWQLSNSLLFAWGASKQHMPLSAPISGAVIYLTALFIAPSLFKFK